MLLLSSGLVVDHRITGDSISARRAPSSRSGRNHWPEIHGLLGMTIVLLFGPKLLALALRLWSTRGSRRFGGRAMT